MSTRLCNVLLASGALALAAATAQAQELEETPVPSGSESEQAQPAAPAEPATPVRAGEPTRAETRSIYTVRDGDTISDIAKQHGVSVRALAQENRIEDPDELRVGQELTITIPAQKQRERMPGQARGQGQESAPQAREHQPATPAVGAGPPEGSGADRDSPGGGTGGASTPQP